MKPLRPLTRIAVAVLALTLISAYFIPLWQILMWAPQYPEGLEMKIWINTLTGNVRIISALNHYIGMKTIETSMFPEFKFMVDAGRAVGVRQKQIRILQVDQPDPAFSNALLSFESAPRRGVSEICPAGNVAGFNGRLFREVAEVVVIAFEGLKADERIGEKRLVAVTQAPVAGEAGHTIQVEAHGGGLIK